MALRKVPHPEEAAKRPSRTTHCVIPVSFLQGLTSLVTGRLPRGPPAGPAADDAGKHPGIAAGADHHESVRTELVDGLFSKPGQSVGSVRVPRRVELTL